MSAVSARRDRWKRRTPVLAGVVLAAALAGCAVPSPGSSDASSDGSGHDDADVAFATMMVPHHAQAIAMARLAPDHTQSVEVRRLAQQTAAEQMPEIVQLQGLLSEWGRPPAPTATGSADMTGMPGMSGDAQDMGDGMMTDQQMRDLGTASGPAFDRLFLQMMLKHHGGGVAMARTELSDGENGDAQMLAQNISDSQQAEMTFMLHMLAGN